MKFVRVKDKVINLEFVRAIFLGDDIVIFDDGSPTGLAFAIPEAGVREGLLITPVSKEDLDIIIADMRTRFPSTETHGGIRCLTRLQFLLQSWIRFLVH